MTNNQSKIINNKSSIPGPYPGPRSFNEDESLYFKGRDQYLDEMTKKLEKHHFLMVTGSSGDGKSSLIFAGLVAHARAGFLKTRYTNWVFAHFRPKRDPLRNLSVAISTKLGINDSEKVEHQLTLGFSALVDLYKTSALYNEKGGKGTNLLILADQFEEFFTNEENYDTNTGVATHQAQMTVQLLLETVKIAQKENIPVYVVCTMRSDFFGNCNAFQDLPEMIEQSQKFLGRLSKQHILEAISEPAKLAGIKISERLLQMLMNEITGDVGTDMLPILQHCLYQIYEVSGKGAEEMDMIHYAMVGGFPKENLPEKDQQRFEQWLKEQPVNLQNAYKNPSLRNVLDIHANRLYDTTHEYYNKVSGSDRRITKQETQYIIKVAFQCLTKMDENRAVRSLISLQEIIEMLGYKKADREKVARVLDIFRIQGNTFLRPFITKDPATKDLRLTTVLDITHEALMRNWKKLEEWAWEEHERVIIYRDLCAQLEKWQKNEKAKEHLLSGGSLNYFEKWYDSFYVAKVVWLRRYVEPTNRQADLSDQTDDVFVKQHLEDIKEYLRASRENINRKRKLAKVVVAVISLLLLIATVGFFWANMQKNRAVQLQNTIQNISRSNELATEAYMTLDDDPTLSFRLAEQAYKIYPTNLAKQVLMSAYARPPFYNSLRGHNLVVSDVNVSFDGKYVVTASFDQTLRLWNGKGNLLKILKGHKERIHTGNFSPDGKYIISASDDSTARLWDLNGKCLQIMRHNSKVHAAYFSPTNNYILTIYTNTVGIWDFKGNVIHNLKGHEKYINDACFFPDGKYIVTASRDKTAKLWDIKGNQLTILKGHSAALNLAKFSPDGKHILTASHDGTARLWDLQGKELIILKGHTAVIYAADFSPDSKSIVTALADHSFRIWDINGNCLKVVNGHTGEIRRAKFSPDGKNIVTVSSDHKIKIWDMNGDEIFFLKRNTWNNTGVNFFPDGSKLAASSADNTACIWNLQMEENPVLKGHKATLLVVKFSPDGKYILTASRDVHTARLWNRKGDQLQVIKNYNQNFSGEGADFSSDSRYFLTASSDNTVKLWDISGKLIKILKGHIKQIYVVKFSPDGKYIVTTSRDNTARIWDINGDSLKVLTGHTEAVSSVDFSPDAKYLVTASRDKTARLWDLKGNCLKTMKGHKAIVWYVKFSPDGKYIITASNDNTLRIWDKDGNILHVLEGHTLGVFRIDISYNSKYIVSAADDGTARVWDMNGKELLVLRHIAIVNDAVFSPDGNYIATVSADNTAKIWDLTGKEIQVFRTHKAPIWRINFSPDGKYISTASVDNTACVMPVSVEDLIKKINIEKVRGNVWELSEDDKKIYRLIE
ncbi:MAG: hypothetical protein FVQ77_02710 [Cytophagales bacterium]|nr:hypothetical protein [Cytophagales bacterium]